MTPTSRRTLLRGAALLAAATAARAGGGPVALAATTGTTPVSRTPARAARPLQLLILGGTGFLGPHVVEYALARGHTVTLFNRGRSAASSFSGRVELLRGDRDAKVGEGLTALEGTRRWDAVIDISGYVPRHVRDSAALLRGRVAQYLFVSTVAVYDFAKQPVCDEQAPLLAPPDPPTEVVDGRTYGPLKVDCERAVNAAFDGVVTHVRPTYIFGPGDDTDRFTYWIERVARGGAMVGPPFPQLELQWVDARDLYPWMVDLCESRTAGVFNAAGPQRPISWREVLETLRVPGGTPADIRPATPELMRALKFALPLVGTRNVNRRVVSDAAQRAGLRFRPLAETVAATREWWRSLPESRRAAAEGWPDPALERQALERLSAVAAGPGPA
jgi:2'-hydroxyisoflavone reductase